MRLDFTFGIRFPPSEGPRETGALAAEAERAGFRWIWGVDSPLLAGPLFDPYVDLVAVAQCTTHAMLGPAVTPLLLRTPIANAAAILSLDRISNGRAVLGLGSGGSALVTLGVSKRLDRTYTGGARQRQNDLAEEVAIYRRLFAGEPISFGTREIQLDRPRPIKIYVAASGPRMLELAGAIADGVIIHVGIHPVVLADAIERVRRGARAAGRDPGSIDLVCSTYAAVSPNGDRRADIEREHALRERRAIAAKVRAAREDRFIRRCLDPEARRVDHELAAGRQARVVRDGEERHPVERDFLEAWVRVEETVEQEMPALVGRQPDCSPRQELAEG